MQKLHLTIVALFFLIGCGTMAAPASIPTPVAPSPGTALRQSALPPLGACPPGTPRYRCKTLVNATMHILVVAYIDNQRLPSLFPYGGRVPLARLLPGEKTQFALPEVCTRYDKDGYCVYAVTADAYEGTDATLDPQLTGRELSYVPVLTEATRHCYYMEFAVPRSGDKFNWPVAIQDPDNRTCPNKIVPKGKEKIDAVPDDDDSSDEDNGKNSPKS